MMVLVSYCDVWDMARRNILLLLLLLQLMQLLRASQGVGCTFEPLRSSQEVNSNGSIRSSRRPDFLSLYIIECGVTSNPSLICGMALIQANCETIPRNIHPAAALYNIVSTCDLWAFPHHIKNASPVHSPFYICDHSPNLPPCDEKIKAANSTTRVCQHISLKIFHL
jgi:hypothetical protein